MHLLQERLAPRREQRALSLAFALAPPVLRRGRAHAHDHVRRVVPPGLGRRPGRPRLPLRRARLAARARLLLAQAHALQEVFRGAGTPARRPAGLGVLALALRRGRAVALRGRLRRRLRGRGARDADEPSRRLAQRRGLKDARVEARAGRGRSGRSSACSASLSERARAPARRRAQPRRHAQPRALERSAQLRVRVGGERLRLAHRRLAPGRRPGGCVQRVRELPVLRRERLLAATQRLQLLLAHSRGLPGRHPARLARGGRLRLALRPELQQTRVSARGDGEPSAAVDFTLSKVALRFDAPFGSVRSRVPARLARRQVAPRERGSLRHAPRARPGLADGARHRRVLRPRRVGDGAYRRRGQRPRRDVPRHAPRAVIPRERFRLLRLSSREPRRHRLDVVIDVDVIVLGAFLFLYSARRGAFAERNRRRRLRRLLGEFLVASRRRRDVARDVARNVAKSFRDLAHARVDRLRARGLERRARVYLRRRRGHEDARRKLGRGGRRERDARVGRDVFFRRLGRARGGGLREVARGRGLGRRRERVLAWLAGRRGGRRRGCRRGGRGRGRGRRGWGRFEGRRHRRGRTRRVRRTRPRWRDRRGGQRGRRARGFRDADQTRALRFLESLLDPHRKIDGRACGRGKGRGRGKRTDATSVRAPSERRRFRGGASDGSTGLVAETRRTGAVILQRLVLLLQLAQQPGVDLDRGRVGRHRAPSSETRGAHFKRLFSGVDEATKENGHFDHQQFLFFRCRRCALRTTRRS